MRRIELAQGVDRVHSITSTSGIFQKDFLSDQEQLLAGGSLHLKQGDMSDRWYIPYGIRRRQFSVEQIREVRSQIHFMPANVMEMAFGVSLEPGQQLGFGLAELDEKGVTQVDPQLVVATLDHRTGEFDVINNEMQKNDIFMGERGSLFHLRSESWQPEWSLRRRHSERG